MWLVTIIGSSIAACIIIISYFLNSSVQQATIAIGFAFVIIPYCIARSLSEWKKEKAENKLPNSQTSYQEETKKCPNCAEVVANKALNCILCDHQFDLEEIQKQGVAK